MINEIKKIEPTPRNVAALVEAHGVEAVAAAVASLCDQGEAFRALQFAVHVRGAHEVRRRAAFEVLRAHGDTYAEMYAKEALLDMGIPC